MHTMRALLAAVALVLGTASLPVRAQEPLILGVAPFVSTHLLLEMFGPLARSLEEQVKRPVHLATAPDSRTFAERSLDGEYDFVVVSPHVARLLEKEAKFTRLAGAVGRVSTIIVVRKGGRIGKLADLRGKTIAVHDLSSMSALQGREQLAAAGMTDGKDPDLRTTPNMMTAIYAVAYGDKDAALVSANVMAIVPPDVRQEISPLAQAGSYELVGALLAHPRVSQETAEAFSGCLQEYFEQSKPGRRVMRFLGFEHVRPLTEMDLKPFEKYALALRRAPGYAGHFPQAPGAGPHAAVRGQSKTAPGRREGADE